MSTRLRRRIARDFPEPGSAEEVVRMVGESSDSEHVQAAIVLWGHGDLTRLLDARRLAGEDWRDVLMRTDLADEDWRDKLDAELGPPALDRNRPLLPRLVLRSTLWEALAVIRAAA